MHLFRVDKKDFIDPGHFRITGDDLLHIKRSLRKKENDHIFASDGEFIYKSRIKEFDNNSLLAEIVSKNRSSAHNKIKISLFAGLVKSSKFELLLNHAAQLGAAEIFPVITEYTQNRKISPNKLSRWEKIIHEASKQSFNPCPPVLKKIISFQEAILFKGPGILLHPYSKTGIKEILGKKKLNKINIYIGPEAGFSEDEIKLACKNKIDIVKMPYNILRSETAALALLSIIFYYRGS